jgi:hypothetical protein
MRYRFCHYSNEVALKRDPQDRERRFETRIEHVEAATLAVWAGNHMHL